jgi:hypothetical protein
VITTWGDLGVRLRYVVRVESIKQDLRRAVERVLPKCDLSAP